MHASTMKLSADTLNGVHIFAPLDRAARDIIAGRCAPLVASAGEEVVTYQDECQDVYFLVTGEVRATMYSRCGKEVAFRELTPGEIFGDMAAIDGERRCASVIALRESTLATMSAEDFRLTCREFPDVAEAVMRGLTDLARLLTERIVEFSTMTVANRIHAEILRVARSSFARQCDDGIHVASPPTHDAIAKRIGSQREAVTKEMSRLRRNGLVTAHPEGGWLIPDLTEVQALLERAGG
jgi:CRP-like cAMP-binding protein